MAKGLKVLEVVRAEDGIYGEFGAEGAEVAGRDDSGLGAKNDVHGFFETRLDDHFASGDVEHLCLAQMDLVLEVVLSACNAGFFFETLLVSRVGSRDTNLLLVGDATRNVNDASSDTVCLEVLLDRKVALRPLSGRGVGAADEHCNRDGGNEDEGYNECDPPCHVWCQVLFGNERVKHSWHDEVCNSTSCITPATGQSVCSSHDVLVEEACRPYLTRHERSTEDADKESQDVETGGVGHGSSKRGWDGSKKQTGSKGDFRTEAIAGGAGYKTNEETEVVVGKVLAIGDAREGTYVAVSAIMLELAISF